MYVISAIKRSLFFGGSNNHAGKGGQSDHVGQDHELIEKVLKFPDQIILDQSSQIDESEGAYGIEPQKSAL